MRTIRQFLLGLFFLLAACDSDEAPECFRAPGSIEKQELELAPFDQLVVYGKVKVLIRQGADHKVVLEAGENLKGEVRVSVEQNRLVIKDLGSCAFFRTEYVPVVHVTTPELNYIENSGNQVIQGVGSLSFPSLYLVSNNLAKDPEVYTNGDFRFELDARSVRVSGDDFSNFYLSGRTGYLLAQFWAGDGRLEASELTADSVRVFHRGTNKMIVHPLQSLKGEIRSTGDVLSVERPPVVEVQAYYTGKLLFQ